MLVKSNQPLITTPTPPAGACLGLLGEQVVTFPRLVRHIPRRRMDRPTHVSTIHRWRSRGLKGVRLEAVRLGGTWVTSLEAYHRFCSALTRLADPSTPQPDRANHELTERLLDVFGVL